MGSLNRATVIGYLGRDPEIRRTQGGQPVCNFSVATSESWTDQKSGEKKEKTEWHNIVVWSEGLVKVAEKYLHKGSQVFIEGKLQTRKWQDKNGQDRYSTEIVMDGFNGRLVMLGRASEGGGGGQTRENNERAEAAADGFGSRGGGSGGGARREPGNQDDMNDQIPFNYPLQFFLEDNR